MRSIQNETKKLSVLITGIGGGGHGEQILKALRIGKLNYNIIGTDANPACANRHEVDHFETLPRASEPNFLPALLALSKRHKCVAVFHGSEPEMMIMSRSRSELKTAGLYVPVNPPELMEICQDKVQTTAFLKDHGVRVPSFREINKPKDILGYKNFPAVLKPSTGGGGSANVFIVQSPAELEFYTSYLLNAHGRFVLQEYVGTPEDEYTVGVLFGSDGTMLNSIAIRRVINNALTIRTSIPNRCGRVDLGSRLVISTGISQGQIGTFPEIRAQCEHIAKLLKPVAPINIQCRLVDGEVIPFEINPRFSGTTSLRALAGYNEPDILIRRDILGEEIVPGFSYQTPLILRGLQEHVVNIN